MTNTLIRSVYHLEKLRCIQLNKYFIYLSWMSPTLLQVALTFRKLQTETDADHIMTVSGEIKKNPE